MSFSDPLTLLISALSPSEPDHAPQPPTVASRLTHSRAWRGSRPPVSPIIQSPCAAPPPRPGPAGALARATMSSSRRRWEKYHGHAAGGRAPSTDPSRTWVVIVRNEPPLPGSDGLTRSL